MLFDIPFIFFVAVLNGYGSLSSALCFAKNLFLGVVLNDLEFNHTMHIAAHRRYGCINTIKSLLHILHLC